MIYSKVVYANTMRKMAQDKEKAMSSRPQVSRIEDPHKEMRDLMMEAAMYKREGSMKKQYVQEKLLFSALNHLYESVLTEKVDYAYRSGLVNAFIKKEGCANLLRDMKTSTNFLSEISNIIDKHTSIILEQDEDKVDEYNIPEDKNKNFLVDIKIATKENEEIENTIKEKVQDAIEDFIEDMIDKQNEIKETIENTSEKIDQLMPAGLKELKEEEEDDEEEGEEAIGAEGTDYSSEEKKNEDKSETEYMEFDDDGNVKDGDESEESEELEEESEEEEEEKEESSEEESESKEEEKEEKEEEPVKESSMWYSKNSKTHSMYMNNMHNDIRHIRNRRKSLLEQIYVSLSKNTLFDESATEYTPRQILVEAKAYYTFLEMLNSYNIIKFNENNIRSYIE